MSILWNRPRPFPGAQSIARAARLLRLVTARRREGAAVAELARRAELSRSTTHRLLSALRAEGLVDQDEETWRWMPGPELYLMGTVAASRYDITGDRARHRALARREDRGERVPLGAPGDETVCLLREEGSFPIRSFVLTEGVRFPLGVASAGLAILAFLLPTMSTRTSTGIPSCPSAGAARTAAALRARDCRHAVARLRREPRLIVKGS